jgi:hypothetical protein
VFASILSSATPHEVRDFSAFLQNESLAPAPAAARECLRRLRPVAWIAALFVLACSVVLNAQSTAPAALIAPAPSTVLTGSTATFSWSAGTGVSEYILYLGTLGQGTTNIYSSPAATTATSVTVSGIPTQGVTLYATVLSKINGAWVSNYFTYTEAGTASLAVLTSPTPGSTLTGASATFSWTTGSGPTAYIFYLGTLGQSSSNIYSSGVTTGTSVSMSTIPTQGVTLYATLYSKIDGAWQTNHYTYTEAGTAAPAVLTGPAPGSALPGSSATFSWTAGSGPTAYILYLGTTKQGSTNLYSSPAATTAQSVTVSGLPENGVTVYATLLSKIDGSWVSAYYTYTEAQPPVPAVLTSPAQGSVLPGSSATFAWSSGTGVTGYTLMLGTTGAGSSDIYNSGSTTATSATVNNLPTGGLTWGTMDAWLQCASPAAGTTVSTTVLASCTNAANSGSFSLSESPLTPMQVAASQGALGGSLTVGGTTYAATTATQSLSFNHQYDLENFNYTLPSGANSSVLNMNGYITFAPPATGSGTDNSYDFISAQDAAGNDGFVLQLHSGTFNGCAYCVFLETDPNSVTTHSASGISIVPGTRYAFSIQANENTGVASLAIYNATTFAQIGSTITAAGPTGNYIANILVGNNQTGAAAGSTSFFENLMLDWSQHQQFPNVPQPALVYATLSSQMGSTSQSSSYTFSQAAPIVPPATLSAVSCTSSSMTGSGTDACTVTLSGAAPAGGMTVSLASNNSAVTVPATVTVAASATSAAFTATVATVTSTQTATLTASASSASPTFALQLIGDAPALSVSSASLSFGDVYVNNPATESLTLTSTGNQPVTVTSASLSGAEFSASGATFPVTLNPGQTATLDVAFDPTAAGSATGQVVIASNSTIGATVTVSLSGTGEALAYQVNLNWTAPSSPSDPIAGYNVYRAVSGSTSYQMVNSGVDAQTTFTDTTVQQGQTYDYYIETVDASGNSSAPSTTIAMVIP